MKIKELHLRNIASIEEADIDFEKDLKDGITGKDANVFLISGVTGAGKSVILDGISMALYKTTPRIAGVMNVNNNEFSNSEGESIRVGSIEQYTRLGISDKDACYSELVFIGNDNQEYRAKLTLGITKSNRKDANGNYPLHHSSPKWEVKVGSGDWIKCNEQIILQAVGLTFQQFGRMAMLAQGQFAAFLTGDKKEREAILEQLTNTEHFSAYGNAIKSLFDKAKGAKDTAKTAYDTEAKHKLEPKDLEILHTQKSDLEKKEKDLDKKTAGNDATLAQVTIIETNRSIADKEGERKAALEAVKAGDEYKTCKALIADWDATVTERQRLSDLKMAQARLKTAEDDETKQKESFASLASDLQARREALAAQGDPQKAVDDKQAVIDTLTAKRSALNPAKINEDLLKSSADKVDLGRISTRAESIKADEAAARLLKEEITSDEIKNKANADAYAKEKEAYDAASAKKDEAQKRLLTMQTGVEDTMIALRKRLAEDHAEVCPLCGQRITEIHLDDEIRQIVTPLEKEFSKAMEDLSAADKSLKAAKKMLDTFSGALSIKKKDLERRIAAIKAAIETLGSDAARFGIDITKHLPEQIAKAQEAIAKREEELKAAQKQAEEIQNQITKAHVEKKPLDTALQKYNSDRQKIVGIEAVCASINNIHPDWKRQEKGQAYQCIDILSEWNSLYRKISATSAAASGFSDTIKQCTEVLDKYYSESGKTEDYLAAISGRKAELEGARKFIKDTDEQLRSRTDAVAAAEKLIKEALDNLGIVDEKDVPEKQVLLDNKATLKLENDDIVGKLSSINTRLEENAKTEEKLAGMKDNLAKAKERFNKWDILNSHFGGTRFRTLVQTYILRPLLNNANIYLEKITDRYSLTCSEDNEQLSILVLDRYNKDQIRSVTVLSGGERFMISLALSLALSSLNRPDMNVNILFIDEGFGTLDEKNLESVMQTLEKLQEIAGQSNRRVGIISHREELDERIPVQIQVKKKGEGRSHVEIKNTL